ncbi:glycosyltransferase [Endozoicomonas sp. ISHI1]|uniref:glycosyltransferase n=1 Tax=Endozoicomonas sp. ISHI1 TaxID=2825882 RepID=UPI0021481149|nr:glycosyltransferase [Endozoicomonas sp. ISHI1]
MAAERSSIAVVIVTYNRAEMLSQCLNSLRQQQLPANMVYVVDNASTDHTLKVLEQQTNLPFQVIRMEENVGGAGGFSAGLERAYYGGYEWLLLIDDDVLLDTDCLLQFMKYQQSVMIGVREDQSGKLVERALLKYELRNPFCFCPGRPSIKEKYSSRDQMPELLAVEGATFEGFMVNRRIVDLVGFPNPDYFIFYDDLDYTLRIRDAGFKIQAIRDARIIRQQSYDTGSALSTWKGFYMYRNFFLIHYLFGSNILVKLKPVFLFSGAAAVKIMTFFLYPKYFGTISKAFFSSLGMFFKRRPKITAFRKNKVIIDHR